MRATKRLEAICSLVQNANVVADIGTDHGYLTKMLFEKGRAKKVIATDISVKSLAKATDLASRFGFLQKIEPRVGDGLSVIKSGEADVVVIAGMGGYEIIKILQKAKNQDFEKYIFQPAQNTIELRKFLLDNNFKIIRDFIVRDQNKFYNTLEVEKTTTAQKLEPLEIKYGLTNFDLCSADFRDFLLDKRERAENILKTNNSPKLKAELAEVDEILKSLFERS